MAKLKKSVKTGKAATGTTWDDGLKVEVGDDCEVLEGHTVEWNSSVNARSIVYNKGSGLTGASAMIAGASTAGPSNILIKVHPELSSYTWSGGINIGTSVATPQTISMGGHTITGTVSHAGETRCQIKLLENLKCKSQFSYECNGEGLFDMNEKTLESEESIVFAANVPEVKCTNAKMIVSGSGLLGITCNAATTYTGSSSCILEVSNTGETERAISAGTKEWSKVVMTKNTRLTQATIKDELVLNTEGAAAGKGAKLGTTGEVILGASAKVACNGIEAKHAKLESPKAAEKVKLKLPASVEQSLFLDVRDVEVAAGSVWNLPNGFDSSNGTKTNESNVRIEFNAVVNPGLLVGSATLRFVDTTPLSAVAGLGGSSTLRFVDTTPLSAVAGLRGTSNLRFAGTPGLSAVAGLVGSSTLRFTDSAAWTAVGRPAGASVMRFTDTAPLSARAALSGSSVMRFPVTPKLSAVGGLRGASTLRFVYSGVLSSTTVGRLAGSAVLSFPMSGSVFVPRWVGTAVGTVGPTGTIVVVIKPTASVTTSVTPVGNVSTQIEVA